MQYLTYDLLDCNGNPGSDGYAESWLSTTPNCDGTYTLYTDVNPYDGVWDADVETYW